MSELITMDVALALTNLNLTLAKILKELEKITEAQQAAHFSAILKARRS